METKSTLQEYICGSLRKTRSGRKSSRKWMRLKAFLPSPSMFQVMAEKVECGCLLITVGFIASTEVVDLSELGSLNGWEEYC